MFDLAGTLCDIVKDIADYIERDGEGKFVDSDKRMMLSQGWGI